MARKKYSQKKTDDLKSFWKKYGGIIILIILVLIIIYFAFFHKEKSLFDNKIQELENEEILQSNENDLNLLSFLNSHLNQPKKKITPPKESKGEIECKRVMESIFNRKFIKIRPKFLMNTETGKNLELDVYNPELKIAVEYSGEQHYRFIPYFHKRYSNFVKQRERDELKKELCEKNGILLIEVPYNVEDIEKFIRYELKKNNKI